MPIQTIEKKVNVLLLKLNLEVMSCYEIFEKEIGKNLFSTANLLDTLLEYAEESEYE